MAAKRDTTVAGIQNPLATEFNKSGGIVPNAHPEFENPTKIAGPKEIFDTIKSFLTGHKNSTNNRMSPSTTKDKGY